jgi:hypothetical protein
MSFKYVLFQEVGKAKKREARVRANSLPMLVRALYVGLHDQKRTGKRMFNLSGGAGIWLEFFDQELPFAAVQRLAPNSFSRWLCMRRFCALKHWRAANLRTSPNLRRSLRVCARRRRSTRPQYKRRSLYKIPRIPPYDSRKYNTCTLRTRGREGRAL